MQTWIYKSNKKSDMYLYLAREDGFDDLPEGLQKLFGRPELVMQLDLQAQQKLAREDVAQVIAQLQSQDYFLQMPVTPLPPVGQRS